VYKKVKLQQREYVGTDGITKYKQSRINIPHSIIQKMGWNDKEQITIFLESKRKGKKRIILTIRD